jgi:hypothetical protein
MDDNVEDINPNDKRRDEIAVAASLLGLLRNDYSPASVEGEHTVPAISTIRNSIKKPLDLRATIRSTYNPTEGKLNDSFYNSSLEPSNFTILRTMCSSFT